jgi:predicted mannosyl-3-phosphoglycerate phosphatase (HAD superfamily)
MRYTMSQIDSVSYPLKTVVLLDNVDESDETILRLTGLTAEQLSEIRTYINALFEQDADDQEHTSEDSLEFGFT